MTKPHFKKMLKDFYFYREARNEISAEAELTELRNESTYLRKENFEMKEKIRDLEDRMRDLHRVVVCLQRTFDMNI